MKILVVDDEMVSRTKMMKILCEFGECVVSESGSDALEEFKHAWDSGTPFDLISLDINMADISGIDVLKAIRSIELERNVKKDRMSKVMMVTSHADQDVVIGSMKAGCNNYIVKPFTPERVVEKVRSLGFNV
jgi:CheY-like chemotaxis protein